MKFKTSSTGRKIDAMRLKQTPNYVTGIIYPVKSFKFQLNFEQVRTIVIHYSQIKKFFPLSN